MSRRQAPVRNPRNIQLLAERRLFGQRLLGARFDNPADVVRWLGAVQSQDYAGAKWGVAQRMQRATDALIDDAFNRGDIIRTHILRATWHFVVPEDLRWMQALTAPRVQQQCAGYNRRLGLDARLLSRALTIIARALEGGQQLRRRELGELLAQRGIETNGMMLGQVMMHAELECLVCSGAVRGKQHTYALADERIPATKPLERETALALLTRRYFRSHGPATPHDFAWWASLTVTEARQGIALLGDELASYDIDGKTYWWSAAAEVSELKKPLVHLLPNYDEHVVAYRDHSPSVDARTPDALYGWGNALTSHLIILNGFVIGGWRRTIDGSQVELQLQPKVALRPAERKALLQEARRFGEFLEMPVATGRYT